MNKVIIKASAEDDRPTMQELFPDREFFTVKYRGATYDDAWEDESGHIWFCRNKYEYVPESDWNRNAFVNLHGMVPSGPASYSGSSVKQNNNKVEIIR